MVDLDVGFVFEGGLQQYFFVGVVVCIDGCCVMGYVEGKGNMFGCLISSPR